MDNEILLLSTKQNFKPNLDFSLVHNGNISNVHKYITYEDELSDTQNIIKFFENKKKSQLQLCNQLN